MSNYWLYIILVIFFPFMLGAISIAPWVPTRWVDIKRILDLAKLKWWEKIYEIGSWDGRISFSLWWARSDIEVMGIEINTYLYIYSKIRKFFLKIPNVDFVNRSLYRYDLTRADIVYLYGLPDHNEKVVKKLKSEMKPWSRVISYVFELSWLKLLEINKPTKSDLSIYLYEI